MELNMTDRTKMTVFYFLAIVPFNRISFLQDYFHAWTSICIGGRILVLLYGIYSTTVRKKFSVPLALAVIYFLGCCISTCCAGISYTPLSEGFVYLFGLTLLIEDGVSKDIDSMIDGMLLWFEILIYANLLFYILYSAGCFAGSEYVSDCLFGNRDSIIKNVFLGIVLGGIQAFRTKNRITLRFACMWLALIFYLIPARSMTATMGMLVFASAILWHEFKFTGKYNIFKYEYFIILSVLISIQFAVLRRFSFAQFFITKILRKSMTLSGRTRVWRMAINKICESPFLGFGQLKPEYAMKIISAYSPHNMLLGTLLFGGILGLIILILILAVYGRKIYSDRKQNRQLLFIFEAALCACFIMWCFERFAPIKEFYKIYALFVMAYYCEKFEKDMTTP